MHSILNDTLERALIATGHKKASKKTISERTLAKRLAAVRLLCLNPDEFENIATIFKNNFMCDEMVIQIRAKLVSYYYSMTDPILSRMFPSDDFVQIASYSLNI